MRTSGLAVIGAVTLALCAGAEAGKRKKKSAPPASVSTQPVPATQTFECPASQRVELDPDAWKAQVSAAKGWREQNRMLAKLRVRPVWVDRQSGSFPSCEEIATLQDVAVNAVDLTHSDTPDLVVVARYGLCVNAEPTAIRVQVLRPIGKGSYCALGDELSIDRDSTQLPCELAGQPPRTFDFVSLLSRERQAIEVRDFTGRCDDHPLRREELSYFSVEGGALRRLFQLVTLERTRLDSGEEKVVTREVKPTGDFPKELEVTLRAHAGAEEEPARTSRYVFRGEAYERL